MNNISLYRKHLFVILLTVIVTFSVSWWVYIDLRKVNENNYNTQDINVQISNLKHSLESSKNRKKMPDILKSWKYIENITNQNNVKLYFVNKNLSKSGSYYSGNSTSINGRIESDNPIDLLVTGYLLSSNIPIIFYSISTPGTKKIIEFSVLGATK